MFLVLFRYIYWNELINLITFILTNSIIAKDKVVSLVINSKYICYMFICTRKFIHKEWSFKGYQTFILLSSNLSVFFFPYLSIYFLLRSQHCFDSLATKLLTRRHEQQRALVPGLKSKNGREGAHLMLFCRVCLMNEFSLSWIMSNREHICFQSLQETWTAWENNTPELALHGLISGPELTWRDLCLWSHFMLWK